jgi:hypothetical protein
MARLVCAQHGHVVNGVQVPCGNTRNETKPLPEAKRARATDPVKEGYGNDCRVSGLLWLRSQTSWTESKPRADGQEPDRRPTGSVEVAQHTEDGWYAPGGKSGGSAVEQRAITWGDLFRATGAEVSRGRSSRETSRSANEHGKVAG